MVISVSVSSVSAASTVYVNVTGGSDDTGDGSIGNPYQSISKGVGSVDENGIVTIADGVYNGTNNTAIIINKSMIIRGQSQNGTIIDAAHTARIFIIQSGKNVTIQNLTLANGTSDQGSAIYNSGNCSIISCNFTNNIGTGQFTSGGAIYNEGNCTIINSTFTGNIENGFDGGGGALGNYGICNISDCNFTGNYGYGSYSYAGAIYNQGLCTVNNSTFAGNNAYSSGAIKNDGSFTVTNSTFTGNAATYDRGGAINNYGTFTVIGSTFTGNTATGTWMGGGYGGVIYNERHSFIIINSTFTGNAANQGGVIDNGGWLTVTGSTFVNNYANEGSVIYHWMNYGGQVEAHFNRFYNNGASVIRSNGYANVTNNWWGSNNSPSSLISGAFYAPWLILSISADPNSLLLGQSSNITVDLNHNWNGTDIQDVSTLGQLPDGIPVTFTAAWGSFSQSSTNFVNGQAKTTFLADEASSPATNPVKVYALADNENNVYASVNIIMPTIVSVDNITNFPGQDVNLTANVTDYYSTPVNEGNVTFKVNGTTVGTVDVISGVATLKWTIPSNWNAGIYNISAEFLGTSNYLSNSSNGTLTVKHIPTNLTIGSVSGYKGSHVTLTAKIENTINNITLQGKTIDFYVNGVKIGSNSTNVSGEATYVYTILENIGNYNISAIFNGDNQFEASNNKSTLTVNPTPTKTFTLSVKNTGTGRIKAVYYVTVYRPDNAAPIFKKYVFYLNPGNSVKFNIGTYALGTAISTDELVYNYVYSMKTVSLVNTWTATGLAPYVQNFVVSKVPASVSKGTHAKKRFWINQASLGVQIVAPPKLM